MNRPRHLSHTAIAVALALTLAACGKSPEQHLQQAQEMVRKAEYKAAVIELKSVLQKQPDNREARQLLGEVFIKRGAYPDAEKELSRARSLGATDDQILPPLTKAYVRMGEPQKALGLEIPESGLSPRSLAAVYAMRAEAQLAMGDRAEAERSISTARQADAGHPELLLTQAKLALMDRQPDLAERLTDGALQQDPGNTEALYFKAVLLELENKPQDAIRIYQQIVKQDPTQFHAHLAIAGLHMKRGERDAADKAIQSAEKIAQKSPAVMYARGSLELQRGDLDKASTALLDVLRVAPDHMPSVLAYAMASYGLGNYEQSIKNAGKVLGAAPNNILAANILAGSQLKSGDIKGALRTLEPLLAKHPDNARLLAMAGDAHLQAGDYNKAMAYLDRAAELEPQNAAIRTRQAAGHLAAGAGIEALADLEAAASLSDKPGQADVALVMLHLKAKEFDKALQSIAALEKKLPNNPVTHNLRAAALLGKQDRAGARKSLEHALSIQPSFFPAVMNLARLDMQDGKPQAARKRFETVLQQDKANVQAMLALADLAAAEKKDQEYVSWLEKAGKAQPGALIPNKRLIEYYLVRKDNEKAMALAKVVADANPDDSEALNLLGSTQAGVGDLKGAIKTFERLTAKDKNSPDAYLRLALAQMVDKQPGPARASLERAIKIKPDHIQSHDALLRLELAEKKPDAALRIARQIQALQPKAPIGYDREADILLSQKRAPDAVKAYQQALDRGAGATALVKQYRALNLAGDSKGADQRLKSWIQAHPDDLNTRIFAAGQYHRANRDREAIALYEDILKKSPNHVATLNNLATLYQKAQDKRALPTAEQAYKLAPQRPEVQDTLGWILVEQGQIARAVELLRTAAGKLPNEGSVRYHYAVALAKSGKKAAARKEVEQALKSGQPFPEEGAAKGLLQSL